MCLTAAGRIQSTDESDDDSRFYSTSEAHRSVPSAFSNLPYDASTCTKLQHLGKAVEVLTNTNVDSATLVLEMCTRVSIYHTTYTRHR